MIPIKEIRKTTGNMHIFSLPFIACDNNPTYLISSLFNIPLISLAGWTNLSIIMVTWFLIVNNLLLIYIINPNVGDGAYYEFQKKNILLLEVRSEVYVLT